MKLKIYNKLTGGIRDVDGLYGSRYSFVPTSNRIEDFDADMSDCILMMGSGVKDVDGEEIFSGHNVQFLHKESGNVIMGLVVAISSGDDWLFLINCRHLGLWKEDRYYGDYYLNGIRDVKIVGVGVK